MSKLHSYNTLLAKEAKVAGYEPLTIPYIPKEYYLMERVISDMKRGRTDYAVVVEDEKHPNDLCVYRKNIVS